MRPHAHTNKPRLPVYVAMPTRFAPFYTPGSAILCHGDRAVLEADYDAIHQMDLFLVQVCMSLLHCTVCMHRVHALKREREKVG